MYQLVVEVNNSSTYIKAENDVFTKDTRVSIFDNASDQFLQMDGTLKVETCALEMILNEEDPRRIYFTQTLSRSIYPNTNIKIVIESPNKTFRNIAWPSTMGNEVRLSLELIGQTDEEIFKNALEVFNKGDLDNSEALLAQISDNEYPGVTELLEKIRTKRQDSDFFKKASEAFRKRDLENAEVLLSEISDKRYPGRAELLKEIKDARSDLETFEKVKKSIGNKEFNSANKLLEPLIVKGYPGAAELLIIIEEGLRPRAPSGPKTGIPFWAYLVAVLVALFTALVIFWSYRFNESNIYAEKIWSQVNQVINIFTKNEECKLGELLSNNSLTTQEFDAKGSKILSNCISKTSKVAVVYEIEGLRESAWANLIVGHLYNQLYEHPIIEKKLGLTGSESVSVALAIQNYKWAEGRGLTIATKYLRSSCLTIKDNSLNDLLTKGLCD